MEVDSPAQVAHSRPLLYDIAAGAEAQSERANHLGGELDTLVARIHHLDLPWVYSHSWEEAGRWVRRIHRLDSIAAEGEEEEEDRSRCSRLVVGRDIDSTRRHRRRRVDLDQDIETKTCCRCGEREM